jgi:hypothetical protein
VRAAASRSSGGGLCTLSARHDERAGERARAARRTQRSCGRQEVRDETERERRKRSRALLQRGLRSERHRNGDREAAEPERQDECERRQQRDAVRVADGIGELADVGTQWRAAGPVGRETEEEVPPDRHGRPGDDPASERLGGDASPASTTSSAAAR